MSTRTSSIAILLLASLGGTAAAKGRDHSAIVGDAMTYARHVQDMRAGTSDAVTDTVEDCRSMIADAKKLGLKGSEHLESSWSGDRSYDVVKELDDQGNVYVLVDDLPTICDDFAKLQPAFAVVGELEGYVSGLDWKNHVALEDVGPDYAHSIVDEANKCMTTVDAAIAATSPDVAYTFEGERRTLGETKSQICQALLDWGNDWVGKLDALNAKRTEDAEAPYKNAGMKGDRLALFSYFGDTVTWLYAGCVKSSDDPEALKKAKKLFIWFTAEDGKITIQKYVFKGDKYKMTEKYTYNPDTAYKYCK